MKRARVYIALLLLLSAATCAAAAEDITEEAKAKLGLAKSYANLKRYGESIALLKELYGNFPDNEEISGELANALYSAGMDSEADRVIETMLKLKLKDTQALLNLTKTLSGKARYFIAEKICNAILRDNPEDIEARLWLARVLSWDQQYDRSLAQYDEIIRRSPKWLLAWREKARVLGWQRRYADSVRLYKRIVSEVYPGDKPTLAEMNAKKYYYNLFDINGAKHYRRWLELEKDNPEALFDLGQIYARQMRWPQARETYERLLRSYPDNHMAKAVLDKVNLYSRSAATKSGFSHYEADSTSRDIDEKYWKVFTNAVFRVNRDFYLGAGEEAVFYAPSTEKSFNRMKTSISLQYYNNPVFSARGSYSFSVYDGAPKNSNNYDAEINYRPVDMITFSFYSALQDVEDNPRTMIRNLRRNDFSLRSSFQPNRRITAGMDYTYANFSDKNHKYTYGIDAEYHLLYEPHVVTLRYRYEAYGFDESRDYYFTPDSFHFNSLGIEWRQFLNKNLFWGSNDTFFTFGYAVNFDVHEQIGNRLYADIHRDWNNRLSTHIEWSKKIYNHRDIYGDEQVIAFVKYDF